MFASIFDRKVPDLDKLLAFGFVLRSNKYVYSCKIVDGQFELQVEVLADGTVITKVIDVDMAEEYVLHKTLGAEGGFIGKVRTECNQILQQIAENCFYPKVFKSVYAEQIIQYVKQKYHDEFEFLWNKFPDNAIVRRQDNKKWYAAILTVAKNKLGLVGDEKIEVIDLRYSSAEIDKLVDGEKYFYGYHMNKKHWITICLDGRVSLDEILRRVDDSYVLAKK